MPTPDQIALPELPEPSFKLRWDSMRAAYYVSKPEVGDTEVFTADQMRAYGQACVEALTPAPQVQGDMVLVPREPTREMMTAAFTVKLGKPDWMRLRYQAMLSAAPPMNEPFGNAEELASREQRARELLTAEMGASTTDDKNRVPLEYALRAITAALSAQPRGVELDITETMLHRACEAYDPMYDACGGDTRADMKQSMRRALEAVGLAAPQPREVLGVDAPASLVRSMSHVASLSECGSFALNKVEYEWLRNLLATTPQDAAGAETGCLPFETVSMVADALTILGGAVPEGGEEKAARADELVRTLCHEVGRLFSRARDCAGATSAIWDAFNALEDTSFGEHASAKHVIRPYLQGGDVLGWRLVDGLKVFGIVPASGLLPRQDFVRYDDHLAALTTPPPGVDVGKLRELVAKWRSDADQLIARAAKVEKRSRAGVPVPYDAYELRQAAQDANGYADDLAAAIDAAAPGVGNG